MVGKELKTIETIDKNGGLVAPLQFEPLPLPLYLEIAPKDWREARKGEAENIETVQNTPNAIQNAPDFEAQKGGVYIQNNITNNTTNNYYNTNNIDFGRVSGVIIGGVLVLAEFLAKLIAAIIVGMFKGVVSGIVLVLTKKTEPQSCTNNANKVTEIEIDNGNNITYYPANNNSRPTYFINIGEGVQINKNHE